MRNELVTRLFSITTLTFFYCIATLVYSQCLEDQQFWLLQWKNNLEFAPASALVNWNQSNDCCGWFGVTCDNFGHVKELSLQAEIISGSLPSSFANLSHLVVLDLTENNLTGLIPSFRGFENLIYISLALNGLTGPIPSFQGATNLTSINLSGNALTGPIPSLEGLPKLQDIALKKNSLNGSIPSSLFSCPFLAFIDISNNQLSGSIQLENFYRLPSLFWLELSHNNLLVNASFNDSILSSFPQLDYLGLASCKLQTFPPLMNQSQLTMLDLSDNQIFGVIPNWISNLSTTMRHLNLSCNHLVGFEQGFVISDVLYLDLHSNQLRGEILIPTPAAIYVDYSRNNFNSSIPAELGNLIPQLRFLSLSNNMLSGTIPPSICNGSYLEVLNLSNNRFTGTLPQCLIDTDTAILSILYLQNNQLTGKIPGTFPEGCNLWTLELNGNHLEGGVPKSLASCKNIEVLNLGTNTLSGNFPCFLANLSNLRILVLRSNKLDGNIHCRGLHNNMWPNLQIMDLALNNFSGTLPPKFFSQRKAMMDGDNAQPRLNYLGFEEFDGTYYEFSVTVRNKGLDMELVKIITTFTAIDLSSNNFKGEIPDTFKDLNYLYVLDLSHNALSGSIPSSLGNMTQLESLDLSCNKLSGSIPVTLASLTFLEFLNLSYNQLVGLIPRGTQLQSFSETSFEGNKGLCGAPLVVSCNAPEPTPLTFDNTQSYSEEDEINLVYIAATLGYAVGFGVIVVPLLFSKRWRQCYYKLHGMQN